MAVNVIQEFVNEAEKLGYSVSPDLEGNIRVSDSKHGLIIMRVINLGDSTNFELTHNDVASEEFIKTVKNIFEQVLNK